MRGATAILMVLSLAGLLLGCAEMTPKPKVAATPCLAGQEHLRTAQLFLGRKSPEWPVTEPELRRFVDQEVTPRFPDGVTVLAGGGQWRGPEDQLMRDAAKVVMIILPAKGDVLAKIDAVRAAYQAQFRQESTLLVTQPACVTF